MTADRPVGPDGETPVVFTPKTLVVFTPKDPKVGDAIQYAELGEPQPTTREPLNTKQPVRRGTSNGNDRGSSSDRRARRAWLLACYASDIPGLTRCYRCGRLLFNPDDHPEAAAGGPQFSVDHIVTYGTQCWAAEPLTIDRIIPGAKGGTYRRNNIRPACAGCNSETGGALAHHPGKRKP